MVGMRMRVSGSDGLPVRRVVSVSPYDGLQLEPDHTLDETKSLQRFLRPISPDAVKTIADAARAEMIAKRKAPLPKE